MKTRPRENRWHAGRILQKYLMKMQQQRKIHKGFNLIITLFVLVQFQMSADCNLHGFSPQGATRVTKDAQFYNSFLPFKKYSEKVQQFSRNGDILTREIRIKQGRLKGIVREFRNKDLRDIEMFLGIPYAAPPIKSLRFMPPGSPPSWKDVKIFDNFGQVCPQTPPDLSHEPFKTMNAGYFNRLKGLIPFLANQSEDCLYLNIYAPMQDFTSQQKYPVIVYIHGESFEWNSGNPYDGSVLASYGNVVVVTINFRLGILGFLRPGLSEHTVSNFGLLDQIAALQWIKDNIEEFGGNPSLVTLMGHGTGAACINFLMVSPVSMASQGLFHKAILMSGTALADWALTHNPLQFTIQVAEALNCPLVDTNDELSNCLRRKRLSEIMSVKVTVPEFQTPFGPIVDGSVVPNTPHQVMGVYQSLFTRYELLYGITEWDSYHLLDPVSLTYGMLEGERNEFLRKYMYSRYEALPYFALAMTLSEYLDWRKAIPLAKSAAEEHRDLVLDLLSDARFAAPVIQMALYHSKINPKSYLYIFRHKSKMGEFAGERLFCQPLQPPLPFFVRDLLDCCQPATPCGPPVQYESERSISGEEIAYVFGIPLVNEEGPLSYHKFSLSEQLLSESILTYFTNFAKTGNPNAPRKLEYLTQSPKEWQQYDVYWPEYDFMNQSYLALGIPPYVSHHYRYQMTQYWNEILPDLLNNPTKLKPYKSEMSFGEIKNATYQKPSTSPFLKPKKPNEDSSPWTYGVIRKSPKEYHQGKRPLMTEEKENSLSKQMDRPLDDTEIGITDQDKKVSMVSYFIAVSVCLLVINVIVIGLYCYKKRKNNLKNNSDDSNTKKEENIGRKASRGESESVYSIVECSEGNQTEGAQKPGKLRKYFNNTTQNHVKVKQWIQQEILEKYSRSRKNSAVSLEMAKPITKSNNISESYSRSASMPKPILKNAQRIYQSNEDLKIQQKKTVQKVSVGIDATPSTRGESVLKQTPIEITKSLDRVMPKLGPSDSKENLQSSRRSRTSISLQMLPTNGDIKFVTSGEPEIIKLGEQSKSEFPKSNLQTFTPKHSEDINVTSRDSTIASTSDCIVDPLENIQKRNFPKVLPDFPESKAMMRLSFPQTYLFESTRNKPNPPPPPPRVSTLQRKNKRDQDIHSKATSSASESKTEGKKTDEKFNDEDSVASSGTNSSITSNVEKFQIKNEKTGKRREQPNIVIQPKIGPKKQEASDYKKAHINLQTDAKKEPIRVLDSKGPSDKVADKSTKSFKV